MESRRIKLCVIGDTNAKTRDLQKHLGHLKKHIDLSLVGCACHTVQINDEKVQSFTLAGFTSHNRPREVPTGTGQMLAESMGFMFGEMDSSSEIYNDDLLEQLATECLSKFSVTDTLPHYPSPETPLKISNCSIK
ncbi:hypothetical protein BLNAU_13519 [Blattamonas nauphoetae]|uniref:Uncharacterized protein n=1 Tax=Blattamonas nauphoetae TaxID=2049346 RepID=A0ABQ9XJD0_9EUKA|nr:hypothetical protein BLNAU_13519 [Blattamonas nauphoetae]